MPHRERIEALSKKGGRKISPELIEEILGSLGPGVIKAVAGVPKIFISSTLSGAPTGSLGRFPTTLNVNEALKASGIAGRRIQKRANIDRPNTISSEGRRANVGGRRPPDTELEALALQKQGGSNPKDMGIIMTKLRELDFPDAGIIRFLASQSKQEISKMDLRFRKELLASPSKPKGSGK